MNGRPFTGGTIPFNAIVDVTNGTVTIVGSIGKLKVYTENKIPARFKIVRGTDKGKPISSCSSSGGNFNVCPKRKTASVGAARRSRARRSSASSGATARASSARRAATPSATVRGTNWLTADRCDGTLVKVKRGVVDVRDIKKNRIVRAVPGRPPLPRHRYCLVI